MENQKEIIVSLNDRNKGSFTALIPLLAFVVIYLLSGIILQAKGMEMAFYQFPAPIAAAIGVIIAFLITKGSLDYKFDTFVKGCGSENIMIMCLIYLLAGAFSNVSSVMGGVESTVNLGLTLIPINFIVVGVFIISGFIALATGTSVGTVVAITPIAVALADKGGLNLALTIGAVVGGSMLGDNLSVISDTTIAATRTQGVEMKDKFRANMEFVIPAALITMIFLFVFGRPEQLPETEKYTYNLIKILPYLFVLGAALKGVNVFVVLTGGIVFSGAIGLFYGDFTILTLVQEIYSGFLGMIDIFLLSLLTGGLAHMVSEAGGLQWIIDKIRMTIKGKKSAELGICSLASLTNFATANNTVSILISGELASQISKEYDVDPRRTASLLDVCACTVQGLIPYGAQLLIAAGFTKGLISPVEIVPYVWYLFVLIIFILVSIFTPFGSGYVRKHPLTKAD
ncbi:MAG: Na+/H+ antiporter NhaC family protein [Clostridia bacterium]|nr:Na+/H+ antiporter NhaC family protein [Clostridia bacterium]